MTLGAEEVNINLSKNILSSSSTLKIEAVYSSGRLVFADQYIVS
jgi:hypothetical protein